MPKVLILRTCDENLRSYNNFQWPEAGPVHAPDWDPKPACGNGLHGFLWGEGKGDLANWSPTAKWLVVEVDAETIVDLDGKVKFPRGEVVFCGDRLGATSFISANGAQGRGIVGGTATAGDGGTLCVRWWDLAAARYRTAVAYVGENGILPNTPYRLQDGKFVPK